MIPIVDKGEVKFIISKKYFSMNFENGEPYEVGDIATPIEDRRGWYKITDKSTGKFKGNIGGELAADLVIPIPQSSLKEETVFFIEDARELFNLYANKQITIGKLTELLNEKCAGQSSLTPKSIRDSDGWISVENDLPFKDGNSSIYCLVLDTYHGIVVRPYNEYHVCWDGEDADDYYTDAKGGKITHWQPLPAPPNEKSASLKPNKLSDNFYGMSDKDFLDMQKDNPKQPDR